MPTLVQRLFDTCREVFSDGGAGVVPSPADIERIISVLGAYDLPRRSISFSVSVIKLRPVIDHSAPTEVSVGFLWSFGFECDENEGIPVLLHRSISMD